MNRSQIICPLVEVDSMCGGWNGHTDQDLEQQPSGKYVPYWAFEYSLPHFIL